MRRREFISLLGGAAAWPLSAHAQQPGTPVIGVLSGGGNGVPALIRGIAESGYENGRNVRVELHSGHYDQFRAHVISAALVSKPPTRSR